MKLRSFFVLHTVAAACAVSLTAACSPSDRQEVRNDASRATQTARNEVNSAADKTGTAIDNASLTTKVKAVLLADEMVKGTQINVDSENGFVTLSGTVDTSSHKQRAEQLAMNVEGVRSVRNNLATK